jgi:CheY-like chemotaxis protein
MTRGLAAAGFKVTAVAGAIEALEACTAWRPDAVVAAAAMPGMSGIDLAYAMSEHGVLADVPLLLSAEEQGDLARLEAYRAGVRDYVPRPFLDEELVIRVHRVAAPPPTGPRAGLHGRLDEIGLPTLLSLFEFERKSGVLLVLRAGRIARLFLAEGRILKAEVSGAAGDGPARVLAVLDWHDGQFEFTPTEIEGRDEIGASITQLLLEHARRSDEASRSS